MENGRGSTPFPPYAVTSLASHSVLKRQDRGVQPDPHEPDLPLLPRFSRFHPPALLDEAFLSCRSRFPYPPLPPRPLFKRIYGTRLAYGVPLSRHCGVSCPYLRQRRQHLLHPYQPHANQRGLFRYRCLLVDIQRRPSGLTHTSATWSNFAGVSCFMLTRSTHSHQTASWRVALLPGHALKR